MTDLAVTRGAARAAGDQPLYGPGSPEPDLAWGPAESWRTTARSDGLGAAWRGLVGFALTRGPMRRLRRSHDRFQVGPETFEYPSMSLSTERRVEIPVGLRMLERTPAGARILEVGRVLHRWSARPRDVVDRYERGPGVLNQDILEFQPDVPYGAIVSVSTLEHVGFDEPDRDLGKFERAVNHLLEACLARDGRLLVTLPLDHHPRVDEFILGGHGGVGELHCMERVSAFNEWRETGPKDALEAARRHRFPGAGGVAFWSVDRGRW